MENETEEREKKQFSKETIDKINNSLKNIKKNIKEMNSNFGKITIINVQSNEIINKEVEHFENWLDVIKQSNYVYDTNMKKKFFDNLTNSFDKYDNYINKIEQEFEKIKKLNFSNTFEVRELVSEPPPINTILSIDSSININMNENNKSDFYEDIIPNLDLSSKSDKFNSDGANNKEEMKIEEKAEQEVKKKELEKGKIYEKIKEKRLKNKEIVTFLNSITQLIKRILMKSSYLLKKRIIKSKNVDNDINENINIIRNFKYPYIENENNDESELNFIKEINKVLKEEFDEIKFCYQDFNFYYLDNDLKEEMLKIYEDKNTKDFISMVKHFSLDSLSENEINENFIREIKVEKNMNEYSEELKKFKKQKENMWENYLKKYDYKSSWIDKNQKPNDLLSLKELTDLLKYLSNINIHRNKLIEDEIVKKMTGLVISHKNDPKYFGKYLLIDFFITTEKFAKLSISDLIFDYPNILELHIFKILIDELCKECGIKENIDYRGNFINIGGYKNKKLKQSRPGKGWMGIGIKLEDKYYDDEYGNIYMTIGRGLNSNEIKEKLKAIINNKTFESKSLTNILNYKKENNIEKEKKSVLFSKDIIYIEKLSGIISFKNRSYRIILSAKIKTELLDENKLTEDNNEIKVYAILLKKI